MRNTLTLLALVISVTGIFVSLAREELRCYIGLGTTDCYANPETAKEQNPSSSPEEIIKPSTTANTETTKETEETASSNTPDIEISPQIPTLVEETKETASSNTPSPIEETSQPQSQPIEVIPPPEEALNTQSQPIEVIPPPEQ